MGCSTCLQSLGGLEEPSLTVGLLPLPEPAFPTVIPYTESGGALIFRVQVVPRASRSEIVGEHNGALRVRIAAAPVDGAANEELVKVLARTLHVSRSAVEITGGHSARLKTVCVTGLESSALRELLVSHGPKR